jgi:hypothetical protein
VLSRIGSRLAGGRGGWAFAAYLLASFLVLGLPVLGHPERDVVGGLFTDPQIFVWSFAWWPHALLHGLNPIYTHQIWAPGGFNLAWATSVPGLAFAFAPLTLLFGPVLAYNVASILMPALAAWTAFLLARHLTRAFWPSFAAGWIFGFSSYLMAAELTHVFSAAVFLLPVAALSVLRFVEERTTRLRFALEMAAILAGQLLISTEILFTLTLALAAGLLLAALLVKPTPPRLRHVLLPLAGAYALAAAVTYPFVYYLATGKESHPPPGAQNFSADLLNFVLPTKATFGGWWTGGLAEHFPGNDVERGAYLGLPLLAIVVLFAWQGRRTGGGRLLLALFALAVLAAFGSWLTVDGHRVVDLPWNLVDALPLFENVMPVRSAVYAFLAAAVMTALWAASSARPRWLRIVLPLLAIASLLPNLTWHVWGRKPDVPRLFTTPMYKSCIARGQNVLLLPFGTLGDSMMWQARTNYWFRDAGGYISPYPPTSYLYVDGIRRIATEESPPDVGTSAVLDLVRLNGVTTIVLDANAQDLWKPVLAPFGTPQYAGGAWIYRLRGAPDLSQQCGVANERYP